MTPEAKLIQPWALPEEMLSWILQGRAVVRTGSGLELQARTDKAETQEPEIRSIATRSKRKAVAVMRLRGIFETDPWFGGLDTERVSRVFQGFAQDENIGGIVLHIDSPGGSAFGIEEFASQVLEARKAKPIVAVADGMMASAAYWIGASASKLVATPSSLVGSIGVYMMHLDHSKFLDEIGLKPTFIQAGKFKTEGNPLEPLSDAGRDHLQGIVDSYYTKFVKAVAKGRDVSVSTVRSDFGQGRVVTAEDAVKVGMLDAIGSADDVIAGLAREIGVVSAKASDVRRRKLSLTKQALGV